MDKSKQVRLWVALGCGLFGLLLGYLPPGRYLSRVGYDFGFIFYTSPPITNIVIVEMNKNSAEKLGQTWGKPWDRSKHAELLKKFTKDQARLVVFDVLFSEQSNSDADDDFAQAIRENKRVVLIADLKDSTGSVSGSYAEEPLQQFATNAAGCGFIRILKDTDRVVRQLYLGTTQHVSLPLLVANLLQTGASPTNLPVGNMWIRYYGPGAIPSVPYSQALESPSNYFRDRIIFIGEQPAVPPPGQQTDQHPTPISSLNGDTAGVEILATSTLNLMRGDWFSRFPWWLEAILLLGTGSCLGYGLFTLRPMRTIAWSVALCLVVPALGIAFMWWTKLWFDWIFIIAGQIPFACLISIALNRHNLPPPPTPPSSGGTVFISYSHEDRAFARKFAELLTRRGYSVFWDRQIVPGTHWDEAIEQKLKEAQCVIVLWSKHSANSEWVKTEAGEAADRSVLLPVLIRKTELPLRFKSRQTANLIDWQGNEEDPELQVILDAARKMTSAPPSVKKLDGIEAN